MSGHSKFANIKHKKEKNDAKKGKVFTVIGREIVMADRKSTRLNSSHSAKSRMPSSA